MPTFCLACVTRIPFVSGGLQGNIIIFASMGLEIRLENYTGQRNLCPPVYIRKRRVLHIGTRVGRQVVYQFEKYPY